ncbi:MAG: hypothetical protein JNK41_03895, partial [Saprospiraceae bacterium]|nr:hypothetical protein [Saprospiraceae bacterium]
KHYLLALMIFGLSYLHAQSINDIPLAEINVEYIQIVGTSKLFSNKLTIQIDFGQENKFWTGQGDNRIKDVNGKVINFNTMIDALNFLSENGYEFINAYAIATPNQNVYHYILKRQKKT